LRRARCLPQALHNEGASCDERRTFGGAVGGGGKSASAGGPAGTDEAGQSSAGSAPVGGDDGGFGGTIGSFGGAPSEAAGEAGVGGQVAATCSEVQSRITITFADANPERVSAAATTPNVTGQGGPAHCTDSQEWFGQSYGAPEGTLPYPVVGGNLATLTRCGTDATIVLRDPGMTSAVDLTINYDSYSNANLASFVLLQPAAGWKAPITEVEYLCFADLASWPQTARDAAQLPAGCGP
jgi:hypothetical protein